MRLEKRKGKFAEEKFTSALLTFLLHPSHRIWIIPCFISKGWVREHLPILIQANAKREMAASNRNDPWIRAFSHWFPTLRQACVGSGSLRCGKKECVKEKKMDSHPLSSRMFGHPHFHWSCNHNDYMRKLNPHAVALPNAIWAPLDGSPRVPVSANVSVSLHVLHWALSYWVPK